MCVPNAWRPFSAARHSKTGLPFLWELDEVGMTRVDLKRQNFLCELIQHPKTPLNSFYFSNFCILLKSFKIVF